MTVAENPKIQTAHAAHRKEAQARAGTPYPQGATWDGKGVNFSLFSASSDAVDLCFFERPESKLEFKRIRIKERTNGVWHIYIPDLKPGALYGYRVHGTYDPARGLRFNPNKLLLDPYAKAIGRELVWADEVFGYKIGDPQQDLSFDDRDSAAFAPLASSPTALSTGAASSGQTSAGPRQSSTRHMSGALRSGTPRYPRESEAPTRQWPRM